jgi:hypothetical protein
MCWRRPHPNGSSSLLLDESDASVYDKVSEVCEDSALTYMTSRVVRVGHDEIVDVGG